MIYTAVLGKWGEQKISTCHRIYSVWHSLLAHLGGLRRNVRGLLVDAQQLPRLAGHAHVVREDGVAGGHGGVDLPDVVQLPGVAVDDGVLGLKKTKKQQ